VLTTFFLYRKEVDAKMPVQYLKQTLRMTEDKFNRRSWDGNISEVHHYLVMVEKDDSIAWWLVAAE